MSQLASPLSLRHLFRRATTSLFVGITMVTLQECPAANAAPTGIETDSDLPAATATGKISFLAGRTRLIAATLRDQTDGHSELGGQSEWLLTPSEDVRVQGNAFALENTLDGSGMVFLKLAPLPDARSNKTDWDVHAGRDGNFELNRGDGYEWKSQSYKDGKWGRVAAFHALQRQIRPYNPKQDGLFLTNTWGDRHRDAHLNPEFMAQEIEAGARLGADIVQIDDGWQEGTSANSSKANGNGNGVWNGFWATNPHFWDVNTARFPGGLNQFAQHARDKGMQMGLWFAPDSSHEAANWERDANALLALHRELGVNFFKIDALKIESAQSEANFHKLFDKVYKDSKGEVSFDFDITAERRFGPFGMIAPGRLFVENRYTDRHTYWPHQTLRAAWQLSQWVDPVRLRMEWLNNTRNDDKYPSDPLAPSQYKPDALFATTMMFSPLGWFENQKLPESYFKQASPLIKTWRQQREMMQRGTILPVGDAPDGVAWTGFVSINAARTSGYALMFRELNSSPDYDLKLPLFGGTGGNVKVLGGEGKATLSHGVLRMNIPKQLRFIWVQFNSVGP